MKAIIIANMRSGSTFLVSCLGSHSQIEAYDGEPLLYGSPYRGWNDTDLDVLERYYQMADVAKLTYVQVTDEILTYAAEKGLRVIHLTRPDVIGWAFSAATNRNTEDRRYGHIKVSQERPEKPSFTVDVERFMRNARLADKNQRAYTERLGSLPNEVLHLTYDDITGGVSAAGIPEPTGRQLCGFLGLPYEPLTSDRRKSGWPMEEVVTNWPELRQAIEESEYAA